MADDPTKRRPQDSQRVNISEEHEVRYWTEKFGVTREKLEAAVKKVGPMVKDVERELKAA